MNNVIKGDMYIVPNKAFRLVSEWHNDKFLDFRFELVKILFPEVDKNEKFIEICMANNIFNNWSKHGVKTPKGLVFPYEILPVSELEGIKEGESILITTPYGCMFSLKANQLGYKYNRLGKFETVFHLMKNEQYSYI